MSCSSLRSLSRMALSAASFSRNNSASAVEAVTARLAWLDHSSDCRWRLRISSMDVCRTSSNCFRRVIISFCRAATCGGAASLSGEGSSMGLDFLDSFTLGRLELRGRRKLGFMRLGPLGFSFRCFSASIARFICFSLFSISFCISSNSTSNPRFLSCIMLSSSPCLFSACTNSLFKLANILAAFLLSLASSSTIIACFTSAAALLVFNDPASSSELCACFLQNTVDLLSLASLSSAILARAIASALFFWACAAASAALCVTVEFQSLEVQFSALWMACSATLTARAASAREASSSERSSMMAWWSSSTISWSTPPVREETWEWLSLSAWLER
mmetsp:Transcript_6351/g.11604  ORF Transcript_6351/g.11604 Transcript_6351/m.11604 type:complete len:333 (+) Transcript_6351:1385-2383(+)